jgi:serine/threonine protein kinase
VATMAEVWTKSEGELINGAFPLRRLLGSSDHGAVFLTEVKAHNVRDAAIKLVPDEPALTPARLSHWRMAAALDHPHLIRLFGSGQCQLGDRQFLFVVMEYADQTLAQILPRRALTLEEVRELLRPTLDALAFLHGKGLLQGQLKPSNFLVVNDQLKLASDSIRPAGESATGIATRSLYDPPEAAAEGGISAAGDIWALGVTLVEALTQRPPGSASLSLPTGLPTSFVETVWRCLSRDPADRPAVSDLEALIGPAPQAPAVSMPAPLEHRADARVGVPQKSSRQRVIVAMIAVLLLIFAAVWLRAHRVVAPPGPQSAPAPARADAPPLDRPAAPPAPAAPSVLHQELPNVPRSASDTIHGHLSVTLRVTVNSAGDVVGERPEDPGPSKYFARLATAAAGKWKFTPPNNQDSRAWLVRFDFSRDGTTAQATLAQPLPIDSH